MKSQDILLLLKLSSIGQSAPAMPPLLDAGSRVMQEGAVYSVPESAAPYTMRALAESTGISKSEVSLALQRCYEVGLAKPDRLNSLPRVNASALSEFIIHGMRYVFPVKPAELTRGVPTAWAAPALQGLLVSAEATPPVWPDVRGKVKGQAIAPLFKTVCAAIAQDARLYALLALVDAIRIGQARERGIASERLVAMLQGEL